MKTNMEEHTGFKSGFVTLTGAPNVGKSTLLNRILGDKIAITSKKPQTTRNRILGIAHRPAAQMVFMDTPGVHRASNPLNTRIVEVALSAMGDVDLIVFVTDVSAPDTESEDLVVKNLQKTQTPVILALNKIDLVKRRMVLPAIDRWKDRFAFKAMIPLSARHGDQVHRLLDEMETLLPEGPPYFPEDAITDMPERFIAAEMIREKVFRYTGQEIPYSTAVTIDSFKEIEGKKGDRLEIHATIHLERDSQKGIIIGKRGSKLRQIGKAARESISRMTGLPVYLRLFVRIQKNWSKDTRALRKFGY